MASLVQVRLTHDADPNLERLGLESWARATGRSALGRPAGTRPASTVTGRDRLTEPRQRPGPRRARSGSTASQGSFLCTQEKGSPGRTTHRKTRTTGRYLHWSDRDDLGPSTGLPSF